MKLNGKTYKIPELDFNKICQLEDMGVSITEMDGKVLSTVRGFIALSMDGDVERAGVELQEHLVAGGQLDELMEEINWAVENSGFFQALSKSQKKANGESKSKLPEAKK